MSTESNEFPSRSLNAITDSNKKRYYWIFLLILCITSLLGLFSIALKQYIEKRKNNQAIPQVNILPLQLELQHVSQEPENLSNKLFFNNLKVNEPLLSLTQITVLTGTLVSLSWMGFLIRDLRSFKYYFYLLFNMTIDFVFPLLYCLISVLL